MFEGALEIRDPLAEKPRSITLTSRAIPDGWSSFRPTPPEVPAAATTYRTCTGKVPRAAPGASPSPASILMPPPAAAFGTGSNSTFPPATTDFGADTSAHGTVAVSNDYGHPGYGGPNPPAGETHRYVFTVYALDVEKLGLPASTSHTVARFNIMAHTLASGSFTATFAAR